MPTSKQHNYAEISHFKDKISLGYKKINFLLKKYFYDQKIFYWFTRTKKANSEFSTFVSLGT